MLKGYMGKGTSRSLLCETQKHGLLWRLSPSEIKQTNAASFKAVSECCILIMTLLILF